MLTKRIVVLALLVSALFTLVPITSVLAGGSLVQQTSAACASGTSCSKAFGSNVGSGSLIIVSIEWTGGVTGESINDGVSGARCASFTAVSGSPFTATAETAMWYCTTSSSGAMTPSISWTNSKASKIDIYETTGYTTTSMTCSTGSGNGNAAATGSVSFSAGAFLVASIGVVSRTVTAGTGFTLSDTSNNNDGGSGEYATAGISSPTTFPASLSLSDHWAEIGCQFPALSQVVQPIKCTMDNSATPQATVTLSGGSPSPTTVACDGAAHNVNVNPSITLTATEPADGASSRDRFGGGGTTTTVTTCSAGTCTEWDITNYLELENTVGFSLVVGTTTAGLTWTFTGFVDSSSGVTVCTVSPSAGASSGSNAACWSNYNRAITAPAEPSGEAANERFRNAANAASTAGTPTTGGNTYTVNYYRQESNTYQVTTNGQGPPNWDTGLTMALTGTYLGTASSTICTESPTGGTTTTASCSGYADYNTAVSAPALASGSGANIQWKLYGTTSYTDTTGGNTHAFTYYKQLTNTYQATPTSPATWDYAYAIPVKGTIGGVAATTGCTISASNGGGAASCSAYFDYNKAVGPQTPIAAWTGQAPTTFTDTTGGNTRNVNYVEAAGGTTTTVTTTVTTGAPPNYLWLFIFPAILIGMIWVGKKAL